MGRPRLYSIIAGSDFVAVRGRHPAGSVYYSQWCLLDDTVQFVEGIAFLSRYIRIFRNRRSRDGADADVRGCCQRHIRFPIQSVLCKRFRLGLWKPEFGRWIERKPGIVFPSAARCFGEYKLVLTRRKILLAAPALILSRPANAIFHRTAIDPATWPGQVNNPVGFAATPASIPGFTSPTVWPGGVWPGAWPGNFTGGTNPTITSGTLGNANIYAFYDITYGPLLATVQHVVFVGCRFQMSGDNTFAVQVGYQAADIHFFYCSFVPNIAIVSAPKTAGGPSWPSAGAGMNLTDPNTTYQIPSDQGYDTGIELYAHGTNQGPPVGLVQIDHCDLWGGGGSIFQSGGGSGGTSVTDCWMHDPSGTVPLGYHINGIGNTNYGNLSNFTMRHNVVCGLGNNQALAFQNHDPYCTYNNLIIDNNYFSWGGSYVAQLFYTSGMRPSQTAVTNCQFTNNIYSTAYRTAFFWLYGDKLALWVSNTNPNRNRWYGNKLEVWPGTSPNPSNSPLWNASQNGYFMRPDTSFSTSDWP